MKKATAANRRREAKTVTESRCEMTHIVLPNDSNPLGNILGGTVMHLIDLCAAVVAHRHSRRKTVTASMDELDFLNPIKMGQIAILRGMINHVARSSMEIGVEVFSEDILTGERRHCCTAFLTFVAIDDLERPTEVPRLILRTPAEKKRFAEGERRRTRRLQRVAEWRSRRNDA